MTADDLPTCTHVISKNRSTDRSTGSTGAPPLPDADARRGGARRVGGGPVGGGRVGTAAIRAGGPVDTITLDSTARHRRRVRLESDAGTAFVLDLPSARLLREGDLLVLSDRRTIEVRAAAEALHEVRGDGPVSLLRLAWHVGNRHLPTEIREDHLRVREDAVIAAMLEGLGATVVPVSAGFDPEGGAYAGAGHDHGRDHERGHGSSHAHDLGDASGDA